MDSTITNQHRNLAVIIQVSVFSKYFFPFVNFIAPLVLWTLNKDRSTFIDHNGKQALNFQLSVMLYNILLICLGIAFFIWNLDYTWDFFNVSFDSTYLYWDNLDFLKDNIFFMVAFAAIFIGLRVFEIISILRAAVKAKEMNYYHFPLCINFFR